MIFCNIHSNKNTKKRSSGRFFVQQKTIIVQRAQPQQYLLIGFFTHFSRKYLLSDGINRMSRMGLAGLYRK